MTLKHNETASAPAQNRAPRGVTTHATLSKLGWLALCGGGLLAWSGRAEAFCGFYVAKADAKMFNKASQVVLVRDGDRTVLTMASDYQGDPKEFALVVPVPTILEREQLNVGTTAVIDRIDAFTAPRLVEYFDPNPCMAPKGIYYENGAQKSASPLSASDVGSRSRNLGVTVEAKYEVGEYDILILSAKQSDGLQTWLTENGYKTPAGANRILGDYIKNGMKFFVAKVNLKRQSDTGLMHLRPLQMAYESSKFILPLRLGTLNANGPQELFIYGISKQGRLEPTNYRMAKIPSGEDVPLFVKEEFKDFYKDMFSQSVKKENMNTVFLEYAWNMASCDPCAADPLTPDEQKKLGVFWLDGETEPQAPGRMQKRSPWPRGFQTGQSFVSRLHVRYDAAHFPEDLALQTTGNAENFQGRYVLNHPWEGTETCDEATAYRKSLGERHDREAVNLATLTGRDVNTVREKMHLGKADGKGTKGNKWYNKLWK